VLVVAQIIVLQLLFQRKITKYWTLGWLVMVMEYNYRQTRF